jgi:hypothetical protein
METSARIYLKACGALIMYYPSRFFFHDRIVMASISIHDIEKAISEKPYVHKYVFQV